MEVEYMRTFAQDLKRINETPTLRRIERVIVEVKDAKTLRDVRNLKKLEDQANAFRIRIGDYRIGFYLVGGRVLFAHVANRRDIYRVFP